MNCMQVSDFGECMRCHCGYVFSEHLGYCEIAPRSLIGCETATVGNACSRPKVDYLLLKLPNGDISLEFAMGSHCEIFDYASNFKKKEKARKSLFFSNSYLLSYYLK
jgi:hypothetical protein